MNEYLDRDILNGYKSSEYKQVSKVLSNREGAIYMV